MIIRITSKNKNFHLEVGINMLLTLKFLKTEKDSTLL